MSMSYVPRPLALSCRLTADRATQPIKKIDVASGYLKLETQIKEVVTRTQSRSCTQ